VERALMSASPEISIIRTAYRQVRKAGTPVDARRRDRDHTSRGFRNERLSAGCDIVRAFLGRR
jgi:hypothetical protein